MVIEVIVHQKYEQIQRLYSIGKPPKSGIHSQYELLFQTTETIQPSN